MFKARTHHTQTLSAGTCTATFYPIKQSSFYPTCGIGLSAVSTTSFSHVPVTGIVCSGWSDDVAAAFTSAHRPWHESRTLLASTVHPTALSIDLCRGVALWSAAVQAHGALFINYSFMLDVFLPVFACVLKDKLTIHEYNKLRQVRG